MPTSKNKLNYIKAWRKENEVGYRLNLNREYDKELIAKINEHSSKSGFVKDCLYNYLNLERKDKKD